MTLPKTPSLRLDGRRALVTGAGRGIGLACAAALAEAGAAVTLVARSAVEVTAAADEMAGADHATLDVTDLAAVTRFFAERPAFDILVNNAGTNRVKPIWDVTLDDYATVVDLNLRSAFFVAQGAAVAMRRDRLRGSLIHMGSQMGHVGGPGRTLYCASKWGLEGLSKALALDLAPDGIRSNTVAPTFVETAMTRAAFADPVFRDAALTKIKLGRFAQPEDVMGAILFLASDASAMVTGTSIVVDGGWTAD